MRQQCVAHHFKVKWSKFKVTRIVRCFCCVRFVAACYLTDLLEVWLKYNPLLSQKPRSNKVQGHTGRWRFFRVCSVVPIYPNHMWHKYNPWGDDVSHTIAWTKGQISRSRCSFGIFALFTSWLHAYLPDSFHMDQKYNPWPWGDKWHASFPGPNVKGQEHMNTHSSFI